MVVLECSIPWNGSTVELHKVVINGKPYWLSVELQQAFSSHSQPAYRNALQKAQGPSSQQCSQADKQLLVSQGAIHANTSTSRLLLVSTHRACQLLASLGVAVATREALSQAAVGSLNGNLLAQQPDWQAMHFPSQLPECTISGTDLGANFGLQACNPKAMGFPLLQQQLQAWKEFITGDVVLSRNKRKVECSTHDTYLPSMLRMLGFAWKHCGVQHPTFFTLADPQLVSQFVAFSRARGVQGTTLVGDVQALASVIDYMHAHSGLPQAYLDRWSQWSKHLQRDLQALPVSPKPDLQAMQEGGKLMTAEQATLVVHSAMTAGVAAVHLHGEGYLAAQALLDALILACSWSYMPSARWGCLLSTTVPSYIGPCMHENCRQRDVCRGNRLEAIGEGGFKFVFPHHKSSYSRGGPQISCDVPSEMMPVLQPYVAWGHKVLTELNNQTSCKYLLVNRKGEQLTAQCLNNYYKSIVVQHGGPVGMSPGKNRHLFATSIRQGVIASAAEAGPSKELEAGAAFVMGNRQQAWNVSYDLTYQQAAASKAVAAVGTFRQAVLAKHNLTEVQPAANQGVAMAYEDAGADAQSNSDSSVVIELSSDSEAEELSSDAESGFVSASSAL